jgi:hypothetical protein
MGPICHRVVKMGSTLGAGVNANGGGQKNTKFLSGSDTNRPNQTQFDPEIRRTAGNALRAASSAPPCLFGGVELSKYTVSLWMVDAFYSHENIYHTLLF